jgi:hypothetical protein
VQNTRRLAVGSLPIEYRRSIRDGQPARLPAPRSALSAITTNAADRDARAAAVAAAEARANCPCGGDLGGVLASQTGDDDVVHLFGNGLRQREIVEGFFLSFMPRRFITV